MIDQQIVYIILFWLFIIFFVYKYVKKKNINLVRNESKLIQAVMKLNKKTDFDYLQNSYFYSERHNSKRKFDRDNTRKFMNRHIYDNINEYESMLSSMYNNRDKLEDYKSKYKKLKHLSGKTDLNNIKINEKKFIKYEEFLYNKLKLKEPTTRFSTKYEINYTSPKGRNSYSKDNVYSNLDIEDEISEIKKNIKNKKSRQYIIKKERSKMSNSFRYKILKRDSFKCQICGSSAKDGVKLHVDHIIPVSKGGRTVKNNLRTLCDRCNLGKSDKIEKIK